MRVESDFLGELELPRNALYGINALRARINFPYKNAFSKYWFMTMATTKKAAYITYKKFVKALEEKKLENLPLRIIAAEKLDAMILAAEELEKGEHFEHFIVPALQGGAGTSINMNINEIIANRALQLLGSEPGNYSFIDPFEDANIYQSTNDVVPTALKLAAMRLLILLEEEINEMRKSFEKLEQNHRYDLRLAYTQMQAAVPSTWGVLFSAYNDALSRDWWRISKALERIRVVNLGGGAVGTGISLPRFYIMEVVDVLKEISGLPISRAENLSDATSNLDGFVEVHAILKAHATNLEKISSDIRLLSSDAGQQVISIPQKQVGSSIMPGKVNPVIVEYIVSVTNQVYANDVLIANMVSKGVLELNAYLPAIGNALLESIEMLIAANQTIHLNLLSGIAIDTEKSAKMLFESPSITTALAPYIGYHKAADLASLMKTEHSDIFEANAKLHYVEDEKLIQILDAKNLLKQGFSINDL